MERFFFRELLTVATFNGPWYVWPLPWWHELVAAQLLTVSTDAWYTWLLLAWLHEPAVAQLCTAPTWPLYCAPSKCLASLTGLLADLNKEKKNLFRIKLILKTFNTKIVALKKCGKKDAIKVVKTIIVLYEYPGFLAPADFRFVALMQFSLQ